MAKLSRRRSAFPGPLALLVGFAFGTACGLLNGLLITRLRLPPFIVTLGTLSIFFALDLYVSGSRHRSAASDMDPLLPDGGQAGSRCFLGRHAITLGSMGMLVMYGVMTYVLRFTAWGRHVYAIGDDPESARLSGHRAPIGCCCRVYAVAGFIYAIGAWFLMGRIGAASPQARTRRNLDTITAVVIGGTSLFGGRGGVLGTLLGAIIVGMAATA